MINPDTLDTLIAVVIVLLVLSLIVQSIQTVVKKLLKLKSRTILNSLEDLFENTIKPSNGTAPDIPDATSPPGTTAAVTAPTIVDAKGLVLAVQEEFRKLGRENLRGKAMLDSLAKEDLIKVLKKLHPDYFIPNAESKIREMRGAINQLQGAIMRVDTTLLRGNSNAKFFAMQELLTPLMNDFKAVFIDDQFNPSVVLGHLLNSRQINFDEVLRLLGEVQQKVEQDITSNTSLGGVSTIGKSNERIVQAKDLPIEEHPSAVRNQDILMVSAGLQDIAGSINLLSRSVDAALSPLRFKLNEVEGWYDTVMQGFEERYSRNMRTIAIVISFFVVVMLNANFFKVYNGIAHNDIKRATVIQAGEVLRDDVKGSRSSPQVSSPANSTAQSRTLIQPAGEGILSSTKPDNSSQRPAASGQNTEDPKQEINTYLNTYEEFGFSPLTPSQIHDYWLAEGAYQGSNAANRARYGVQVLVGWLIMTLLLSIGAPFWQDALESLFGLKNLLRKKSDTKNIEEEKGGQPHP